MLKQETTTHRLTKCTFPWYSSILLGVQGVYAYYGITTPNWVRTVLWGSFVAENGGVLDIVKQIRHASLICNSKPQSVSGGNCTSKISEACYSCLMRMAYLLLAIVGNAKLLLVLFTACVLFYL